VSEVAVYEFSELATVQANLLRHGRTQAVIYFLCTVTYLCEDIYLLALVIKEVVGVVGVALNSALKAFSL
jgi:hypothetical protein